MSLPFKQGEPEILKLPRTLMNKSEHVTKKEMHKAKYKGRGKRRELQGKRRNGRMPNIIQLEFVCWVEPGISRILFGIILYSLSQ